MTTSQRRRRRRRSSISPVRSAQWRTSSASARAAKAALLEVAVVGYRMGHPELANSWAKDAELALHFAGDPHGLGAARLSNNRALTYTVDSKYERAEELFREAPEKGESI